MDPIEIAVIVGALAVFLLWGPNKIPQLARSLGMAQREFKKAQSGIDEIAKEVTSTSSFSDDKLLEVARSLGISTEGKTKDQIASEIIAKKLA
ncbi:MAG: twin-arginine translocase TatA/TatE family subunit [Nitrososphaeria archaeon]|jgi:sec-independent protein translocase protein TatA